MVRSTKRITFAARRSFYEALSADVPAKEGLNAHAVLIDELHAQGVATVGYAAVRGGVTPSAAVAEHHDGRLRPALDLLGAARLRRAGAVGGNPRQCVLRLHCGG